MITSWSIPVMNSDLCSKKQGDPQITEHVNLIQCQHFQRLSWTYSIVNVKSEMIYDFM